jgi:hypothetical protein
MSRRYTLVVATPPPRLVQSPETTSFVGGRPKLPPSQEIPACGLCGTGQTFVLQVAFPDRHERAGLTLAIFQCTSCFDVDRMMPPLSHVPRTAGEDIPDGVRDGDATSYRFLAFPTADGVVRPEYVERIRHSPIELTTRDPAIKSPIELTTRAPAIKTRSHIGGKPRWFHDDRTPGGYEGAAPDLPPAVGGVVRIPGGPRRASPVFPV